MRRHKSVVVEANSTSVDIHGNNVLLNIQVSHHIRVACNANFLTGRTIYRSNITFVGFLSAAFRFTYAQSGFQRLRIRLTLLLAYNTCHSVIQHL